jgi:lysophospholipase L1-like esterase
MIDLGRLVRLHPGVRWVAAQVARYAASWDESNELALTGDGRLWVVLGDSTAQGVGAPAYDQGYVGQLKQMLDAKDGPWRVYNWSRSGARARHVLDVQLPRLERLEVEPDLVTVAVGANDVYRTPLDQMRRELSQIARRLPEGAVLATLPQGLRPRKAMAANEVIRAEASVAGLVVADVWARTGPPWRGKFAEDHFHPGALGYSDWTAAFAEALGLPGAGPGNAS